MYDSIYIGKKIIFLNQKVNSILFSKQKQDNTLIYSYIYYIYSEKNIYSHSCIPMYICIYVYIYIGIHS